MTLFSARRKLELMQEIGTDGGLFHYVFSGQYGKKVMPHVLEIGVVIYRKLSKLYVFILLLVYKGFF